MIVDAKVSISLPMAKYAMLAIAYVSIQAVIGNARILARRGRPIQKLTTERIEAMHGNIENIFSQVRMPLAIESRMNKTSQNGERAHFLSLFININSRTKPIAAIAAPEYAASET